MHIVLKRFFLLGIFVSQLLFAQSSQQILRINSGWKGPEAGLVSEVLQAIFKEADIGLKVQVLPNKRSIMNANSGIDDGEATRIWNINKYYPNLVRVPIQTHHIDIVALSHKKLSIKAFSDLKAYHVGVVRGMKIVEVKVGAVKPKSLTNIDKYDQLLQMLQSHRLDVIVADKTSLLNEIKKNKIKGLYLTNKPLLIVPLYLHLHKKHQHLIPKIEKAIKTLKHKGSLAAIEDRFFHKIEKDLKSMVTLINEH